MSENIDPFEEKFEFPQGILSEIGECSPLGFILFTITENGEIEYFSKGNMSDVVEAGLRTQAIRLLQNLDSLDQNEMITDIMYQRYGSIPTKQEDSDDDDDDDEEEPDKL